MFNLDIEGQVQIDAPEFPGKSLCILGIAGSGKSNSGKYLITQLMPTIPFTIVDVDDEYGWLKHEYQVLVVGTTANADIDVPPSQAERLARFAVDNGLSVLLDMSNRKQAEIEEFIHGYARGLWECRFQRQPHILLLEEAQDILPQGCDIEEDTLTGKLIQIAKRGRKFNLSLWLISQRPQDVDKRALTQTRIRILHRVTHPLDIKAEQQLLPLSLKGADDESEYPPLNKLKIGQGYVVIDEEPHFCRLPLVESAELGAVPDTTTVRRQIDSALLEQLKQAFDTPPDAEDPAALRETIQQQACEIARLNECVEGLQAEITVYATSTARREAAQQLDLPTSGGTAGVEISFAPTLTTSATPDTDGEYRSPLATQRALNKQRQNFDSKVTLILGQPTAHRNILSFLMQHEDTGFDIAQLGRYVGLSSKTIKDRPPLWMVNEGLIRRSPAKKNFTYQSNARAWVAKLCPDLDHDQLMNQLRKKV